MANKIYKTITINEPFPLRLLFLSFIITSYMAEPRIMIKSINKTSTIAPPVVFDPQLVMNIPPSLLSSKYSMAK